MCLKKKKSRDAARFRRGKENKEFFELANLIPISNQTSSQLDKASIIRLIMSDLQLQMFFLGKFVFSGAQQDFYQSELTGNYGSICLNRTHLHINDKKDLKLTSVDKIVGSLSVQSMNGFVFIIDEKGTFIYVSETVSHYLGTSQVSFLLFFLLNPFF